MAGILTGMAAGRSVLIAVCIGTAVCPIFFAGKNGRRLHFLCPKWSAGYTLRLFLFALLFLAGGLREQQVERSYDLAASHLTGQVNVEIQGRICKKDPGEPGICYQLKDVVVKGENFLTTADSFLLYSEQEEAVMGSVIAAEGIFYPYEQGRNEGNFDRGSYYRSLGISGTIYNAEYVVIESPYVQVREGLWRLREQMREIYDTLLNERDAGVLASMCLGDRSLLPDETKELYQVSGIMHLLAISGMHISILGMGAYRVLRKKFGFLISVIVSYLVVILFGMMIGAGASTLRAILMFGIYLLAQLAGRTYDLLSALAVAGILLLFHQPMLLTYAGFQFSFGAVLGIGIVYPVICVAFFPGKGDVPSRKEKAGKNILFLLAIQWTLLPVTLFHYCKVSVYSIFVNLILVPVAGILMGLGLAGGLAGLLSVRLAAVCFVPCHWILEGYERVCRLFADLPGAVWTPGKPEVWMIAVYYVLFGVFLIRIQIRIGICTDQRRWKSLFLLPVFCSLPILFCLKMPAFEIDFLDVGQGDGIYIQTKEGTHFFIDGGSSDVTDVGKYRIKPFLQAKGVDRIDYWFVSHGDSDHISGLLWLLENNYPIEHLALADHMSQDNAWQELSEAARENHTEVCYLQDGDMVRSGELTLRCLDAECPESSGNRDRNDASLILQLEYDGFEALFAGDISETVEQKLVSSDRLTGIELYKANHHGSKYSSSEQFLERIRPWLTVISCGEDNVYGHPHEETLKRLENIGSETVITYESGQVTIRWQDGHLRLEKYRDALE